MVQDSLYPRFKFFSYTACILYQVVLFFITAYYSSFLAYTTVPDKIDSLINCMVSLMILLSCVLITVRSKVWFLLVGVSSIVSLFAVLALALWKTFDPQSPNGVKILMLAPLMLLVAVEISLTFVSKFTRHHEARVVLREGEQKILLSHLVMLILIFLLTCVASALVWQSIFDLSLTIYVLVNSSLNIKLLHYYLLPRKFSLLRLISSCCFACFKYADASHDAAVDQARHGSITYKHYEGGNKKKEIAKARAEEESCANWTFLFAMCFLFASFLVLAFPAIFAVIFAFAYQSRLTQLSYDQMWVCIPSFAYMIATTIATYIYNKKRDNDNMEEYYEDTSQQKARTKSNEDVENIEMEAADASVTFIPAPAEVNPYTIEKDDEKMQFETPQFPLPDAETTSQRITSAQLPGRVATQQQSPLPFNGDEGRGIVEVDTLPPLPTNA